MHSVVDILCRIGYSPQLFQAELRSHISLVGREGIQYSAVTRGARELPQLVVAFSTQEGDTSCSDEEVSKDTINKSWCRCFGLQTAGADASRRTSLSSLLSRWSWVVLDESV